LVDQTQHLVGCFHNADHEGIGPLRGNEINHLLAEVYIGAFEGVADNLAQAILSGLASLGRVRHIGRLIKIIADFSESVVGLESSPLIYGLASKGKQ
jgi:hypothetical protein